jgi:hypothetical protein
MESLDKITLELLTNKNQYNKYLSKEDPKKYKEQQDYLEKIRKYKTKILRITKEYIEDPEFSINLEMNEMFSIYFKTFLRYFEMKEVEVNNFYNSDKNNNEEDVMFGKIDENDKEKEKEEDEENEKMDNFNLNECIVFNKTMNSFWGKNIKKREIEK